MLTDVEETILCPICMEAVYHHLAHPIEVKTQLDSHASVRQQNGALVQMLVQAQQAYAEEVQRGAEAAALHFKTKHRIRVWLYLRLGWHWTMHGKWPWTKHVLPEVAID